MARFEKSFCWLSAALLIVAASIFMSCDGSAKKAGGGAAGANEEYKLLGSEDVGGGGRVVPKNRVEKLLNDNAKQGWRVRTAGTFAGSDYIILVR